MCTHRLGFLLQIYYLREEVCDLFLLPGSILGLTSQFLRYGRDLETGQPWSDRKFSSTERGRDVSKALTAPWNRGHGGNKRVREPFKLILDTSTGKLYKWEKRRNLLSSFTQSLTSCCSFSSYVSVSDFRWLACMCTDVIKTAFPAILVPHIVRVCVMVCAENLWAERQVLFFQIFELPLEGVAHKASWSGFHFTFPDPLHR